MSKIKILVLITLFTIKLDVFAQKSKVVIEFIPSYQNQKLELNKWYKSPDVSDSITIEALRVYVGKFHFLTENSKRQNDYYLLDASVDSTCRIELEVPENQQIKGLQFDIGVDSNTTMKGVLPGSLDPLNGMYWTWNTGYINAKLEGSCRTCKSFRNKFQFHIGGYKHPLNTTKTVSLEMPKTDIIVTKITVMLDVSVWLANVNFTSPQSIMQPNVKAMQMANNFIKSCSIVSVE